ncbi:hypothetical protein ES703_58636 [subsurface metagenome]
MDDLLGRQKRISKRKGRANMKVGQIAKHRAGKSVVSHKEQTDGITEGQFDEVLKRVIRKPSEKPTDSTKSET